MSFLLLAATLARAEIEIPSQPNILWIDLKDLALYQTDLLPEAQTLLDVITRNESSFFPKDTFQIYGIELNQRPRQAMGGVAYHLNALVASASEGMAFYQIGLVLNGSALMKSWVEGVIPIHQTHFTYRVGLIQRKAILEDQAHGIKKIYALSVGGFDEGLTEIGKTKLLTPRYRYGLLEKKNAIAARYEPAYYKGMPFMPITDGGVVTDVAFHIYVTDTMNRGFMSHGCMRMDQAPVLELYAILMNQPDDAIPVSTQYLIPDPEDAAFPLTNDGYNRFKNFGTPAAPMIERDPLEHLVIMEYVQAMPPFEQIWDLQPHP